ncbi:MAG: PAS domain-containing protein [Betaproteobacteria bacterium]
MLPRPVVLVLVALGLLFAIDLFALANQRELEQAVEKLNHRIQAAEGLQHLSKLMLEMQSGMRGYLMSGSTSSLNRYRAAADRFPDAAQEALALLKDDPRQSLLAQSGAASAQAWLVAYASPLVVKRSAGDNSQRSLATLLEATRKGPGENQAEHIVVQFAESNRIARELVADAQFDVKHKLDRSAVWMRGRAFTLLLALAALTLMLGRTLAKLTNQTRSREVAENATKTSLATLRAMSDASPLGIFLADESGACAQSNLAFERITGLAEAAIRGDGWQATLHPDDRERVVAAWESAAAAGTAFASEHRFVHRNGKVVRVSMKSARMADGAHLLGFACSIEDISERHKIEEALRKCEERLHLALENSRHALFDWHIPSGEIFFSAEWNGMTGRDPQPLTTTARRLNDQIHPDDRETLRDAVIEALKGGKSLSRAQVRIAIRSGQWKQVHCDAQVTERDALGRAVRLTGTIAAD